jgi:flagellar biosynthesis/type III secretory pathway protein FliH
MASYLDNKHSPSVKSLKKLNFVVSPEDKTNTQLGNAVINVIKELVDSLSEEQNAQIFKSVQLYIKQTKRFTPQ